MTEGFMNEWGAFSGVRSWISNLVGHYNKFSTLVYFTLGRQGG